ncbi:MAG: 16S rRNA (guanine(966)-N(2))-methyltransferase RsmD [Gemmatimonadota bacterium]|jgi:16S rRNA (guanine966-N2)-methyltransferase
MRIIAGRWRGHRLKTVKGRTVRPTTDRVREAWMSAMGPRLPGARVLDLYAGSGALGLEALSRGASAVVFVERSRKALGVLRANVGTLGAERQCRIVGGDAMGYFRKLEAEDFDLILADPPYGLGVAETLLVLFSEKGFARELWVEHRSSEAIPPLPGLRQRRYGDTTISTLTRDE